MKIKCKNPTQIHGFGIVGRHEVIDLDERSIDSRIVANFTREDGSPLDGTVKEKPAVTAEDKKEMAVNNVLAKMSREKIMQQLDEFGVTYRPQSKTQYLAKLLLAHQGEIDEV